ncbi:MAG: CsbD family protein [Bdellovibrionales bacterium]|nr:CsbD family protein [Bdellovibrionales bacterium]
MNQDQAKGKWQEIKGEIRKAWGNITGDDLEQTKGSMEAIGGLIVQKYGSKKEEVSQSLKDIFEKFEKKSVEVSDHVKESLRKDQ